jgi:pimeloyl-ACP methyl ester carboxylesterase
MLVNGHSLHVEQYGPENGPVVVLLHHGLGSIKAWRGQIPALADAGYHVVAYDRRGYGGSDTRPGLDLPTFTSDINDLHSLLEQLRIHWAVLVGHSDGGTIALYFSAQYPNLVSCLVTVAAHIYVEPKMELAILGIESDFETDERFRRGLQSTHGKNYEAVFHNWFDGWHRIESRGWDMRPVLSQIRCPGLIVQGEEDEHATPQHARDIAKAIHEAELWLVPGAGHMMPQENTTIFNSRLLQYLEIHTTGEQLKNH